MGADINGESIVNSEAVIGVFAACEWDEISENGHVWIDAIIQETVRRVATPTPNAAADALAEGLESAIQLLAHHGIARPVRLSEMLATYRQQQSSKSPASGEAG